MRIAIDIERATSKFKSGIQWYAYNLIHNLAKIDTENSYILYHFKSHSFRQEYKKLKSQLPEQDNFHIKLKRFHNELAYKCMRSFLPAELFIGKSDVIHTPYPSSFPLTVKARVVVTIHDLFPLMSQSEKCDSADKRKMKQKSLKAAILKSDRIIAVSEYTKNDIIRNFSINPSKINVVHLAVDAIFHPSEDKNEERNVLNKYGVSRKYILFVGNLVPKKNLLRLLLSFEKIKKSFYEYQFVIVGREKRPNEEFFEKLGKLSPHIREDIILTEYVPPKDLPCFYSGAALHLHPSLYEGFGLVILEAMACGCPVITSNISSMPEVAGDAAILVDPYSVEEITSAIKKVLSDEQLRISMRERGLERVKDFSWEKTARETLQVYRETCAGS